MADYIRLYNLKGELIAILENAYSIVVEEKLGDAETLSFSIPLEDPKAALIRHDEEVTYTGKRYTITEIVDSRDDSGVEIKEVTCELVYIELLGLVKRGNFIIDRKSASAGLAQILSGSRWIVGTVEADTNKIYSINEIDKTVLWLIRQWAKVTGTEIQWDSMNRVVNLLSRVGSNRGAGFRYKKNLKSIKRTVQPPQATVLYPYGAGGLSIASINNGNEYIEDYSWYISQGISLNDARQKFKKEYIWQDDRFLLADNLLDAARKKLAEMSQPIISYECTVLDLSDITGLSEDKFYLGDNVRVYDSELGIDVQTRILRLKRYPLEPWKNEVELSYIIPGLQDEEEQSISSEVAAAQPSVLLGTNNQQLSVTTTQQYPISFAITNFSSTNALIGLMVIGQASAAMTVTIKFYLGGTQIGPTIQQYCQTGWNSIGIPFMLSQIPEGSELFDVYIVTSTGTFTIPPNHMQVYVYAANLLGGISPEVPRANWEESVKLIPYMPNSEVLPKVDIPAGIAHQEVIILQPSMPETEINVSFA